MWDHLFEIDISLGEAQEAARLKLVEQVENKTVDQELLNQLTPILAKAWEKSVRLEIIPDGLTATEQIALFNEINNQIATDSHLILDITHAYRHLPMILLLLAIQLRHLKQVRVDRVLYGMFDPDENFARVVDMKGLLDIAEWTQALATFQKDGDYGVFSDLAGIPLLREAAFFERTTNSVKAREKLHSVRIQLEEKQTDDPIWTYFRPRMLKGFDWIDRPARHEWEAALAWRYLEKKDYLRSVLYALESCISQEVSNQKGNPADYDDRQAAHEHLKKEQDDYRKLNNMRNAMAHGSKSTRRDMGKILVDEKNLHQALQEIYKKLLP